MNKKDVKNINFLDLVLVIIITFSLVYLVFILTSSANLYIMDNFVFPLFFLLSIYGLGVYTGINFYKGKKNEIAGIIGYLYFKNKNVENEIKEEIVKNKEYKIVNYNSDHKNKKEEVKKIENK